MNRNLLDILSNSNKDIDNQLLMDYLSGKLPGKEQQQVEEWLEANPFSADALEGLQAFDNKDALNETVNQLNRELRNYIQSKKEKREKRRWKDNPWTYLALVFILALVIVAYVMVKLVSDK